MATFLSGKSLLTAMIQVNAPQDCFASVERAKQKGAEAFGFQIEQLQRRYRAEEVFRDLFEKRMAGYPVYLTSYRNGMSENMTDEERVEDLKLALRCGGTLADVIGDLYAPCDTQLTFDPKAVDRQRQLIDELHEMGKEVLISSHVFRFLTYEQVAEIAYEQIKRGADIAKIVVWSDTKEQELENIKIMEQLHREVSFPFLFLTAGKYCRVLRATGEYYGNCMTLCVEEYNELATKEQVPLAVAAQMRDSLHYNEV